MNRSIFTSLWFVFTFRISLQLRQLWKKLNLVGNLHGCWNWFCCLVTLWMLAPGMNRRLDLNSVS